MKNSFALADFVPYLLNRAGVRIGLAFARDIEPLGVTLPMWRVMAALWESGDRRLGDIAARTSIGSVTPKGSISRAKASPILTPARLNNTERSLRVRNCFSLELLERSRSLAPADQLRKRCIGFA